MKIKFLPFPSFFFYFTSLHITFLILEQFKSTNRVNNKRLMEEERKEKRINQSRIRCLEV